MAAGKPCYQCQGVGHYATASACPARKDEKGRSKWRSASAATTKRVAEQECDSSDCSSSGFWPVQLQRRSVPYHYRERLFKHLAMMRREGISEDVDPREPIDAVLNLVITNKEAPDVIRMNIDATPLNVGAKTTKYHVKRAAEVRDELEGAAFFSELDIGEEALW